MRRSLRNFFRRVRRPIAILIVVLLLTVIGNGFLQFVFKRPTPTTAPVEVRRPDHQERFSSTLTPSTYSVLSSSSPSPSAAGPNRSIAGEAIIDRRRRNPTTPSAVRPPLGAVPLELESKSYCGGRWTGYGRQFARVRGLIVDRRRCVCSRQGGEPIDAVLNQDEAVEYYRYELGCFRLEGCPHGDAAPSGYSFSGASSSGINHLNDWMRSLKTIPDAGRASSSYAVSHEFTIAVTRYEYVNLYHTMTDWYNAYLLARYFGRNPASTHILFVDAHPQGSLDPVWSRLFNSSRRLADLPADSPTYFDDIVWGWLGYTSPISITATVPRPPLVEEFASYFLSAFGITWQNRTLPTSLPEVVDKTANDDEECGGRRLSVLFIWRHDYVAHPRNPSGSVSRKIANEDQLLQYVRTRFPRMRVDGVQIDTFSMQEQLRLIASTDILVGMHGAGMTHAIFLAPGSAIIELAPSYWSLGVHFSSIADWRRLHHFSWANVDLANELPDGRTTKIPPNIVAGLIGNAARKTCPPRRGVEHMGVGVGVRTVSRWRPSGAGAGLPHKQAELSADARRISR